MTYDEAIARGIPRIRGGCWPDPAAYMRLTPAGDAEFYPDAWAPPPAEAAPFRVMTGSYGWEEYRGPAESGGREAKP